MTAWFTTAPHTRLPALRGKSATGRGAVLNPNVRCQQTQCSVCRRDRFLFRRPECAAGNWKDTDTNSILNRLVLYAAGNWEDTNSILNRLVLYEFFIWAVNL